MVTRLKSRSDTTLLNFLKSTLPEWRPKTIKERLQKGCVLVNGEVVTHHAFSLSDQDEIEVHKTPVVVAQPKSPFPILHKDQWIVGIHKPDGLLSVGTDRERNKHALAIMRNLLGQNEKLWPVHRLDRETSGVLLFARTKEVCDALQEHWNDAVKIYLAIIEGHLHPPDGLIQEPLYEDKRLMVRVSSHHRAKDARTRYKTLKRSQTRSLVEIHLDTGRRHQIRAHMAHMGTPVVGDARYGQSDRRMALHAHRLSVTHPITGQPVLLEASPPSIFRHLL